MPKIITEREKKIREIYKKFPKRPYISEENNLKTTVPYRNMIPVSEDLVPGDIILLWRINFRTFTTESPFPKYFEYDYGINARENLQKLIDNGYVFIESTFDSMRHVTAKFLKDIFKREGFKGISALKKEELEELAINTFTEERMSTEFSIRGYALTYKGKVALEKHRYIVNKHPQKVMK
ncbi:hypothetical protein STFE110948_03195 [Streptobacillus felis]|uniref:Uncharacterized protein n=1 Tax=Streptobacillus felis TaxID=1384509 RepID=A0A7Z0PF68_9FUSO|nr:hypothetical protein [Streptobacillus felis]NYV27618.1 hypothetical protein [Streptobacillus felis]